MEMQANAEGEQDPFNQMMAFIEIENMKVREEKNQYAKKEAVPDTGKEFSHQLQQEKLKQIAIAQKEAEDRLERPDQQ